MMPLTTEMAELDEGLDIVERSIEKVSGEFSNDNAKASVGAPAAE